VIYLDTENTTKENAEKVDIGEFVNKITPLVELLAPNYIEYHKIRAPEIKRAQYMDFIVMFLIIISIAILTYLKILEGSAATGLFGAVIGYVFGGLYKREEKQ
jgi:hypothetical protein